jgi:tRNA threonylcarbamoyladenosine biosynthesis protein TsaE
VKSPSYTLVEQYRLSSLYFYHFDFYRFADPSEWETAGLADYFRDDAVCIVEWPERVAGLLPPPDLALRLAHPADPAASGRLLALAAGTDQGERCLTAITSGAGASRA